MSTLFLKGASSSSLNLSVVILGTFVVVFLGVANVPLRGVSVPVPPSTTPAGGPPPPAAYYVYGYGNITTNISKTPIGAGVEVWVNDTTTPGGTPAPVYTLSNSEYQESSLVGGAGGYKNGDAITSQAHKYGNATASNSSVVNTAKPGSWINLTLTYPQLTPHLSANVTSGEATLMVELFNNRTASPNLGGNGTYVFGWIFGDGTPNVWNQANPYIDHSYTSTGVHCARMFVNDTAGDIWETPCLYITANAPPSITSFTDKPVAVNESQAVGFTTSVSGGTAPYTYAYQFGLAGATASYATSMTTNTTSYTYGTPSGIDGYTANVTVTDKAGKVTAPSHVEDWVYLIDMKATPNPADQGQSVSITATASGGSGGTAYTFFFAYGDGDNSGITPLCTGTLTCTATHTYATATTFTVNVTLNDTVFNPLTLTARTVSVNASIPLTVNPSLLATLSANRTYLDIGTLVNLTATASGGTVAYQFFNISKNTSSGAPGSFNNISNSLSSVTSEYWDTSYGAIGSYNAAVRIGDKNGMDAVSTAHVVVVNATPLATLMIKNSTGVVTSDGYVGEVLTFIAGTTAGTGTPGFTVNITFGDSNSYQNTCATTGCSVTTTHAYATSGPFTVTVKVVDSVAGTGSTTSLLTIYNALAVGPIVSNRTGGELNLAVEINATVVGGVPGLTFAWQFGDGSAPVSVSGQATGSTVMETHTYTKVTNATVNVTVNDTQGEQVVMHLVVFVYPDLAVTFTNSTATGNANPPVNATFTAKPLGGSGSYKYFNWSFGNGVVATGLVPASPVTTYWASGNYKVTLLVTDNVSDTFRVTGNFHVSGVNVSETLSTGWNLVAMPTVNESYNLWFLYEWFVLKGAAPSTTSVTVQNVTGAGNVSYPGGAFEAGYAVSPGRGIWVYLASGLTLSLSGNLTAGPLSPALSLQAQWNNLGWSLTGTTSASSLAAIIPGANAVSMWNASAQSYVTYIVGFSAPAYDFSITEGMGILVWVPSPTTFSE